MAIQLSDLPLEEHSDEEPPVLMHRPRPRRHYRLPAILRPRLTPRYILSSLAVLYALYCTLRGMPFFSSNLPEYTGPYSVGTIDIESLCNERLISHVNFKADGKPAFQLETVLFSLYYPTIKNAKSTKAKHLWIPKPLAVTSEGYARFAHLDNFITNSVFTVGLWALVGGTTIPAHVDVPLHEVAPGFETAIDEDVKVVESSDGFPVIVFSHGMASSRTDYTTYCGELASRGYVVAAIEHRDGSGPGTMIMLDDHTEKERLHFDLSELDHDDDFDIKEVQIAFRHAEIVETVRVLKEVNNGNGADIFNLNPRKEGQDLQNWKGRLDMNHITLGGHSYGATGALYSLKGAPSKELPIHGAIILDPGKSSGPLNHAIDVPILVIHSNSWSKSHSIFFGQPHFHAVKSLVEGVIKRGKDAWFMTSLGTSHPSVTDAPLIEPMLLSWTTGSTISTKDGVGVYVRVSEEFLQFQKTGKRNGLLAEGVTHPVYVEHGSSRELDEKMPEMYQKFWQIHVAPEK